MIPEQYLDYYRKICYQLKCNKYIVENRMKKMLIAPATIIVLNFISVTHASDIGTMGRITTDQKGDIITEGLYASKDTYGMRASAVALAIRANPDKPFEYPINGFSWTKALSGYNNRDSVGLYADNTSPPFRNWEIINEAQYTPTSFTSSHIDTSKLKPGMLIDTDHSPKWSAYIVSVSGDRVTTGGWVNTATKKMGTPKNGVGLKINPTSKIWATNFNIFLAQNGRAKAGVIQENGVINNAIANPNEVNGIDNVILPASKFGGTAAYLARSATSGNKQQWSIGYMSQGAKTANFYSSDSTKNINTESGFLENSHANTGLAFSGKNKNSSIEWYSSGILSAKISPEGQIEKIAYKTKLISSDTHLTDNFARYIINSSNDITLYLPDQKKLADGYTLEIYNINTRKVNFKTEGKINNAINGNEKKINLIFTNGEWFIL